MPSIPKYDRLKYIGPKKSTKVLYNICLRQIDSIQKRSKLLSKPTTLQLEPTTKCNLKCKLCENPVWDRSGKEMSILEFKKIIDQFPYLVDLLLQGIGEPLLCNDFFKMIEYCKEKKILVGTTTNATLINEKMAKKLVDSHIDFIYMSIDGASPEIFEKYRGGAKFEHVVKNIKRLAEVRGELKKPRLDFHFTATNSNISELTDVLRLAKDIGVDNVEAQDTHFWGDEKLISKNIDHTMYSKIDNLREFVNDATIEAKKIGIHFEWLGTGGRQSLYTKEDTQIHADQLLCKKTYRSCFITVDGFVTPCACSPDPGKLNFGNILETNIDEIWNSPQYINYRKERLKGNVPELCRTCTVPTL